MIAFDLIGNGRKWAIHVKSQVKLPKVEAKEYIGKNHHDADNLAFTLDGKDVDKYDVKPPAGLRKVDDNDLKAIDTTTTYL